MRDEMTIREIISQLGNTADILRSMLYSQKMIVINIERLQERQKELEAEIQRLQYEKKGKWGRDEN